jgi:hypothetical protein
VSDYSSGTVADKRKQYATLRSALWTERTSGFDAHWRELGEWLMPRRTRFWAGDKNRGDRRNQQIIDSTARFAARTLSSGLHAGLTSPARPWMKLSTPDPDLAEFHPVKLWLHTVTQRMLTVFASTNLYNVLPLVYLDLGVFGTGAMSMVQDSQDLFRAYSYPIGSYALGQDERGLATTFIRDFQLTVRQVVKQFGVKENGRDIDWSNISTTVKDLWNRGDTEMPVDVTWIVKPNDDARSDRLEAKYLPWASCHFETNGPDQKFLRESGFETFPIMAPRWDVSGEDTYGTDCPGMTALGDIKQLQIMQRNKGRLLIKAIDPPLRGPSALRTQKTSTLPGDITYVDTRDGMQGLAPIHEVRLEGFQHLTQDIGEVQYRIQRAFFEDLFLMIARSDDRLGAARPTAREIDERHEEKLLALGPVLERTNDELLNPIIERAFHLMMQAHFVPEPPGELRGVKLRVEYISVLAQAQKLVAVAAHDRFMQTVGGLVQLYPEARLKVDPMQTVDTYAEALGVDPRMVRPTKDAQQLQANEQQQQQQALAAEQAATMAKAAKDASQTPLTGDTALARLVASAGPVGAGAGAPGPPGSY